MSEDEIKFSLRYVGLRFSGARLPLDVLGDLPALRDLITALAKQEFRQKNQDRKRVPRGFDKSISFSLTEIKDGSAVPVFALDREMAQQNLPGFGDQMETIVDRAFTRIAKIFDDAGQGTFPQTLPLDAIQALTRLGENIQEDEKIEFQNTVGHDGNVISIDSIRRKNLLTRVRETYTSEFDGVGYLTGIDSTHNSINVNTEEYGELRFPLHGVSMPAIDFDGSIGSLVEFSLSIALDANDEFKSIEAIHSVDLIKPYDSDLMRCVNRLQELAKVEKGWLGEGHGERLTHLAAMRATQMIFTRANMAKMFRIFPTEDGGLSIEFNAMGWNFAVEISSNGRLEMDGSSEAGEIFGPKSFDVLSQDFFADFDTMTSVV